MQASERATSDLSLVSTAMLSGAAARESTETNARNVVPCNGAKRNAVPERS